MFWRDTIAQLQKAPEGSKLHDLARLEYIVKTEKMPENPEDVEQKVSKLIILMRFPTAQGKAGTRGKYKSV